ncbi:1-phosphofructokinase [Naasia sp. SYSU D00057]|uniref:1-phosphofructokinase n=1 Tax=Naasia sp. SYSU D00057 TaxID=2817380 RepID=UPI001B308A84|nr:1-phosphofructokinase [Naasia sp. SYSU D00057]
MIVTLTANPSMDRTVGLVGPLERGAVLRAISSTASPAGKGVNVSIALHRFAGSTLAVLPGRPDEPVVTALAQQGITVKSVPIAGELRSNITVTEPDGTTTKINEPGPTLSADEWERLAEAVVASARHRGGWVALCGSLPPGVPDDAYAAIARAVRDAGVQVALDTSGPALGATLAASAVDLIKPNAEELVELTGAREDPRDLEEEPRLVADLARRLVTSGVGAVLCTLGAHGAVLVTPGGVWHAPAPAIRPRSTVGAGDSSLAGYLLADVRGAQPEERLRRAVAHGAAAAARSGSEMPDPSDVHELLPLIPVTAVTLPRTVAGI